MSAPMTITDFLKSVPSATSLSGVSMLLVNGSGELACTTQAYPVPQTPICHDANEANPGFSRTTSTTTNLPANGNGGFLLTMYWDVNAKMQYFSQFQGGGPDLWSRRRANNTWGDWHLFATMPS